MTATIADVLTGDARWTVIHADCLDVLPCLPERCVQHVIADPPYSEHVHSKSRRGASLPDASGGDHYGESRGGGACLSRARELGFPPITLEQQRALATEAKRFCQRWVLIFSDLEGVGAWRAELVGAGLQHVREGVWIKLGATPQFTGDRPAAGAEGIEIAHPPGKKHWNGGGSHAVWTHPIVLDRAKDGATRLHTTQKPLSLMLELVELFTDPGDLVLDPFAGSGTTGVACLRLGRRFIGIEKDETYAKVARERLEAESQGQSLRACRAGQLGLFAPEHRSPVPRACQENEIDPLRAPLGPLPQTPPDPQEALLLESEDGADMQKVWLAANGGRMRKRGAP